jgi:hypothetical protein
MSTDLMPSSPVGTFDTAILTRAIGPAKKPLSHALAEEILQWDFSPDDQARMSALSAKAQSGSLSPSEEAEIDSYIRVAHIVNLMQAKARAVVEPPSGN